VRTAVVIRAVDELAAAVAPRRHRLVNGIQELVFVSSAEKELLLLELVN